MFSSFFIAGFECTTGFNRHGQWIDQIAATRHDVQIDEDYRLLRKAGIRAAREGVRWRLVQKRFYYDFTTVDIVLKAARRHNIQLSYDLFHFGYPEGLNLFSSDFIGRFVDYCGTVALHITRHSDGPYCFTLINEPSYFAWAAGEMGLFAPHVKGRGSELKIRLIEAAIRASQAILDVCPEARFLTVDPICRVVAPDDSPEEVRAAENFNNEVVFQSWDMLAGRVRPELGGSPELLDIVGVNYYWTNQWVLNRPETPLEEDDPRYCSLGRLICSVAERYPGNEIIITETSHVGARRSGWLNRVADEAELLLNSNIPLRGICIYPILGMPEWHEPDVWTRMGLWDLIRMDGCLERVCCRPMLAALRNAQRRLEIGRS
ncbi:MAG: glycoside hydrolase [Acidobacteria bacterium]|nr:glycoside hydrolase [Acidobacteriota bacterium]